MPQLFHFATLLLASTTVKALAIRIATTIDDSYDTLGPSIAIGLPQVGAYNGLQYTNWAVGGDNINPVDPGLVPHSPKQYAVAVGPGGKAVTPSTSSIAATGSTKSFDALSFYFGCILQTVNADAEVAAGCSIAVTGYKGSTMIGEQPFTFAQPSNPLNAQLVFADLSSNPKFKGLTNITLGVTSSLDILIIDDLKHINYYH